MAELHLYDFGIFIELAPDEEEKMMLENNIQVAVSQQGIDLEDAIDLREIKNIKLANQLLKIRRKKKQEKDQQIQQQNIQAQTEANMQAQQAAAQMEMQKQQALSQAQAQLEQMKGQMDAQKLQLEAQMESQKLQQEAQVKAQLMEREFQYNMQLRQIDMQTVMQREGQKEDRKDKRTKIQATQQSEMIDQRKRDKPPKNFESSGNDIVGSGFDLGAFEPR